MEQSKDGNYLNETYWSTAEFADISDSRATGAREDTNGRMRSSFYGGVQNFDEALALGRNGWDVELPAAMALAESAVETARKDDVLTDSFNQPVWDVTGAQVDIGAFLAGTPECMIDYPLTETSKVGRVVTLVASANYSGSVTADTIKKRGRVMVALALALSKLGHAVEIWVDIANGQRDETFFYQRVLVKGAHDELDAARLMFALAHPAMLRSLFFGTWDGLPGKWRTLGTRAGRGYVGKRLGRHEALYPEGTIFLPGLRAAEDVPDADEFLRKYLGELGLLAE